MEHCIDAAQLRWQLGADACGCANDGHYGHSQLSQPGRLRVLSVVSSEEDGHRGRRIAEVGGDAAVNRVVTAAQQAKQAEAFVKRRRKGKGLQVGR
ncbi:hypothetical protein [Pigmentiphaga sp.]|uniref:hypothetical protein n=1 Tax=Pigmentiphaga sp. TaxID=1977564 RepID=UPI0025EA1ECF|nr:hypothetical protein [Pigmentiphaga sp.]